MRFGNQPRMIFGVAAAAALASNLVAQFLLRPSISYTESFLVAFVSGLVMVWVFAPRTPYHAPSRSSDSAPLEEDESEEEMEDLPAESGEGEEVRP